MKKPNTTRLCQCGQPTDAYLCTDCTARVAELLGSLPAELADLEVSATRQDRLAGTGPALSGQRRYTLVGGIDLMAPKSHQAKEIEARPPLPPALRGLGAPVSLPETPWPIAYDAALLHQDIRADLTRMIRDLCVARGLHVPYFLIPPPARRRIFGPVCQVCAHEMCALIRRSWRVAADGPFIRPKTWDDPALLTRWLLSNLDHIRHDDDAAAGTLDALEYLHGAIEQATDRRDPEVYAGRCDAPDVRVIIARAVGPLCRTWWCDHESCDRIRRQEGTTVYLTTTCGADLYAHLDAAEIHCPTCGIVYQVSERKAELLDQIPDHLATATAIATALTNLDHPVTADQIRKWAERGRLVSHGFEMDAKGRPRALYRVGDVDALVEAQRDKARARKTATA